MELGKQIKNTADSLLFISNLFQTEQHGLTESEEMEKYTIKMLTFKKMTVTILILDKIDFQGKNYKKEGYYLMIRD